MYHQWTNNVLSFWGTEVYTRLFFVLFIFYLYIIILVLILFLMTIICLFFDLPQMITPLLSLNLLKQYNYEWPQSLFSIICCVHIAHFIVFCVVFHRPMRLFFPCPCGYCIYYNDLPLVCVTSFNGWILVML